MPAYRIVGSGPLEELNGQRLQLAGPVEEEQADRSHHLPTERGRSGPEVDQVRSGGGSGQVRRWIRSGQEVDKVRSGGGGAWSVRSEDRSQGGRRGCRAQDRA